LSWTLGQDANAVSQIDSERRNGLSNDQSSQARAIAADKWRRPDAKYAPTITQSISALLLGSVNYALGQYEQAEAMVEAQKFEGGSIKHDISVAVSKVPHLMMQK